MTHAKQSWTNYWIIWYLLRINKWLSAEILLIKQTLVKNVGVRKQRIRKISEIFICPKHKVRKIN